jgi:hypothetical protein
MDGFHLLVLAIISGIWLTSFALDLYHRRMYESLLAACVLSALYWTFTATRSGTSSLVGLAVWLVAFITFHWRTQREVVPVEVLEARDIGPRILGMLLILYVSVWYADLLASASPTTHGVIMIPFTLSLIGLGLVAAGRFGYAVTCLVFSLVTVPVALLALKFMGW